MRINNFGEMEASSAFFYAAFACFCTARAVSVAYFDTSFSDLKETIAISLEVATLLLLFLKYASQRYTPRSFALLMIAIVLTGYCSLRAGRLDLLWAVLFIGASQNIRIRSLAAISLVVSICSVLLTVLMWSIDVFENVQIMKLGGDVQNSYGYTHPNQFGKVLMSVVVSFIVLGWGRIRILRFAVIVVFVAAIQYITGSRTAAVFSIAAALICVFAQRSSLGYVRWLAMALAVVPILLSFYFMYFYGMQSWHYILDGLLSNRLHWMHYYIDNYGLSLFGQGTDSFEALNFSTVDSSFLVDNAFAYILIRYGIVPFAILIIAHLCLVSRRYVSVEPEALAMLGLMFLVGFSESYFFQFDFNYFLVAYGSLLYGQVNADEMGRSIQSERGLSASIAIAPCSSSMHYGCAK